MIQKILFSASLILSFILFFAIFSMPVSFDYDLGRHLLFGKIMLEQNYVINTNLLSYTNPDFSYVNSHWLSEILLHLTYKHFGINGLIVSAAAFSLLTLFLLTRFILKRANPHAFVFSLPLFLIFWINRSDVRPEIISYFLLVIFLIVLFKFRQKPTWLIFLLIPLEALWVNLHIFFITGLVLIFLFLLEAIILNKFKFKTRVKTLTFVFVLSSLATLLNPSFIKGVINPLVFYQNYGFKIQENLNLVQSVQFFNYYYILPHALFIISLFALLIIYRKKTYPIELLVSIVFSLGAIMAIRNFYLLVYVALFTYIRLISFFLQDFTRVLKKYITKNHLQLLKSFAYILMIFILSVSVLKLVSINSSGFGKVESGQKALDFFIANNLKGPIYNSLEVGQYVAFRLYPDEKVFVDGRPEAYPSAFFKDVYLPSQKNPDYFNKLDKKYNFNTIFIHTQAPGKIPLLSFLLKSSKYSLVYVDSYLSIFLKKSTSNTDLIGRISVNEDNFRFKEDESLKELANYVILFDKIGWKKNKKEAYGRLLRLDPRGCFLQQTLNIYAEKYRDLQFDKEIIKTSCF